jgi:hypothetical protein
MYTWVIIVFRSRKRFASRGKKYLLEEDLLIDINGGDVLPFKERR